MSDRRRPSVHERWALVRFSVVGPLLASPPARGDLRAKLEELAARSWLHPVSGEPTRFGVSTIERWYYAARRARSVALECQDLEECQSNKHATLDLLNDLV